MDSNPQTTIAFVILAVTILISLGMGFWYIPRVMTAVIAVISAVTAIIFLV